LSAIPGCESNVSDNFRDKDVQVKAATIEEGEFVDLKTLFEKSLKTDPF
jgi:hypothetical protein